MSRLHECAISTSVNSAIIGTQYFDIELPCTCRANSCFASWSIGFNQIDWVTWMASVSVSLIVRQRLMPRDSGRQN